MLQLSAEKLRCLQVIYAHFWGPMGEQRGNKKAPTAKELDDRIRDANKHLKKIAIREKRSRLFVRGRNFPPKPGDDEGQRYEIALGVSATLSGLKVAIAKFKEIDNAHFGTNLPGSLI